MEANMTHKFTLQGFQFFAVTERKKATVQTSSKVKQASFMAAEKVQ